MRTPKTRTTGGGMRRVIFGDKSGGSRYQGCVTKIGSVRFEAARARLAKLACRDVALTSDGDTFEYLARGDAETREYLRTKGAA